MAPGLYLQAYVPSHNLTHIYFFALREYGVRAKPAMCDFYFHTSNTQAFQTYERVFSSFFTATSSTHQPSSPPPRPCPTVPNECRTTCTLRIYLVLYSCTSTTTTKSRRHRCTVHPVRSIQWHPIRINRMLNAK